MAFTSEILLLLVLLFFSGFFSAAEVALLSLSDGKLKHLLDQKKRGSQSVKKLKADPQRMLTTILIGNNVVNVASAAVATALALKVFGNSGVAIATGIMTFMLLLFGEIVPKYLTTQFTTQMALFFGPIIWFLSIVLYPLVFFFQLVLKVFDKIFKVKGNQPSITEDELKSIVQLGKDEGAIKESEKAMIHNIFEFDDLTTAEIMTHKADMVIISAAMKIKDLIASESIKEHSRLPVYKKTRDNIVGAVHVKDLLDYMKNGKATGTVEKVMRKVMFVPESKNVDRLLRTFQAKKQHLAIVVSEHGTITGLVTIEDVLEEIVGDIQDETDKEEDTIKKISRKSWKVKGWAEIEDLNKEVKMNIKDTEADTLNGFLQEKLGAIPKAGDEVTHRKFTISVEKIDGHRVEEAKISKS